MQNGSEMEKEVVDKENSELKEHKILYIMIVSKLFKNMMHDVTLWMVFLMILNYLPLP